VRRHAHRATLHGMSVVPPARLRMVAYNFLSGGSAKRAGQWSRVVRLSSRRHAPTRAAQRSVSG
jgi:hypothetical protein